MRSKKSNKKYGFGIIFVTGAIAITWCCSLIFSELALMMEWPLNDIRYTMHAARPQSVFAIFSLICGILGGFCVANYYQRKDLFPSLFLVPFLLVLLSMIELKAIQLTGISIESSVAIHFGLLLIWLFHIFAFFWIRRQILSMK